MKDDFEYFADVKMLLHKGIILPSVGTIIKPVADLIYTDDIPKAILDKAKDRGLQIHKAIYDYSTTGLYIIDPKYQDYMQGFIELELRFINNEEVVYCEKYWGIVDALIKWQGKVYLIDFKTSSIIHKELVALQLTAYKKCYEYMGMQIDGIATIKLTKRGAIFIELKEQEQKLNELVERYEVNK
jgi:hypothetical protein